MNRNQLCCQGAICPKPASYICNARRVLDVANIGRCRPISCMIPRWSTLGNGIMKHFCHSPWISCARNGKLHGMHNTKPSLFLVALLWRIRADYTWNSIYFPACHAIHTWSSHTSFDQNAWDIIGPEPRGWSIVGSVCQPISLTS